MASGTGTPDDAAERLRTVIGCLARRLRSTRAAFQLSPSEYEVLASLVLGGPLRPSGLADSAGLNPTMLSRVVGKLEAAGIMTRAADPDDGRAARVEVTPQGRRLYQRIRSERTAVIDDALSRLGRDDRQTLISALPALKALAEVMAAPRMPARPTGVSGHPR